MKTGRRIRSILFYLLAACSFTQKTTAQQQFAFRVSFTDKNGTSGNLSNPSGFLSARSLARRDRQSIITDSTDLPVSTWYTDTVLKRTHGTLHLRSRWLNNCVVLVTDTAAIEPLRALSFVRSATYIANYASPLHLTPIPQAGEEHTESPGAYLKSTTSGIGYYGDAWDQISLANGHYLHEKGYRGKGKLIAVLDDGFRNTDTFTGFDSMRRENRIADTYNFVYDTNHVYASSNHGTQVLSTMAGIISGTYVGTAPDATYALYITEDNFSEQPIEMDNLVAAMERADSIGADVINISLGYNTFLIGTANASLNYADLDGKSTIAARGANAATAKGMLVVSSAGNEGNNSWKKILTPGDADSALTVGSVNIAKLASRNSGNGPNAAGVIKPDVCMLGEPSVVFGASGNPTSTGGTSLSTPELAGLSACLWQALPDSRPYELRDMIRRCAHMAGNPNHWLGYGVPDFKKLYDSLDIPAPVDSTQWAVFPNPFTDRLHLSLFVSEAGPLQWRLLDISGRSIYSGTADLSPGLNRFSLSVPGMLPHGIYILQLQSSRQLQTIRLQH